DGGVAKVRHHLAALVLEFRLADDEGHRAAAPSLLLEHVLGARAEGEHVAGADGAHVLELLLAVEEPAVVELHGAARLAQIAQPVGHRHEERGWRERAVVAGVGGVRILHRTGEFADLPGLYPQDAVRAPNAEEAAIDLRHGYRSMYCATSSRFQVAS